MGKKWDVVHWIEDVWEEPRKKLWEETRSCGKKLNSDESSLPGKVASLCPAVGASPPSLPVETVMASPEVTAIQDTADSP